MMYDFDNWRANMILEALHALDEKWKAIVSSTEDEDIKADYGNDMMRLHILQESFEQQAVEAFGPGIADFSREPVDIAALNGQKQPAQPTRPANGHEQRQR